MPGPITALWQRLARRPGTLVSLLNALVLLLVLSFVGLQRWDEWHGGTAQLQQQVEAVVQRQAGAVGDQLQVQKHLVRQLVVQINQATLLSGAGPQALQDLLRQFVAFIPGTLDLLLVQPNGLVLSGAGAVPGAHALATYCPRFLAERAAIETSLLWVMPAAEPGARCPPAGSLVLTFAQARTVEGDAQVWLLHDPHRFVRELEQQLRAVLPQARYRVWDARSGAALTGVVGPVDPRALAFQHAAGAAAPGQNGGPHRTDWTDPVTDQRLTAVGQAVAGTPLRVEVVYDEWQTHWPVFAPPLWQALGLTAGLLAVWALLSLLMLRTIRAGERAIARQQCALTEAAQHTQAILDNVIDGVITLDEGGRVLSFNPAAERIFGHAAADVLGRDVGLLMVEPQAGEHPRHLARYRATGVSRILGSGREVEGRRRDGSAFPMHLAVSEIEQAGRVMFVGLVRDISRQRQAEAEIEQLAYYDPVTGLPNRRLLTDRLHRALSGADGGQGIGALLLIDLDDFKTLNDSRGHASGDELLQQVAQRLRACARDSDTVSRFGGDEFVVLAGGLGDDVAQASARAQALAQQVIGIFAQPFQPAGRAYACSGSVGVALFGHPPALSGDEVLSHADLAMYEAKRRGRARYHFYDAALQVALTVRTALEADLRQGLALGQFRLHYQPQVDDSGRALGAEALLRWWHPERGAVSPAQFIPLAEQTGFILELGHWVLQSACERLAAWARDPLLRGLTLAVNVSAHQFKQADFVPQVLQRLAQTGAEPSRLKLELTESTLAEDVHSLVAKMDALRRHGVQFALDDFGTGYSSLSYIKRLPLEQLKVDQGFVRHLLDDANDAAIVRAILTLGHSLGLAVIAEGVETEDQRGFLQRHGCHQFQGYLFSRPLEADAFEAWVAAQGSA